jgi:hypothetical protein
MADPGSVVTVMEEVRRSCGAELTRDGKKKKKKRKKQQMQH